MPDIVKVEEKNKLKLLKFKKILRYVYVSYNSFCLFLSVLVTI